MAIGLVGMKIQGVVRVFGVWKRQHGSDIDDRPTTEREGTAARGAVGDCF